MAMLAMTLYFPALLFIFGTPTSARSSRDTSACILQASAFAAIGLAISSTTENQIVAAFLAFAINLMLWLSESMSSLSASRSTS